MIPLPAFLRALRAGNRLINSETWKNRQALITALSALLLAVSEIARTYGVVVPFADDQIIAITGAVVVLVFNVWATFATSSRVGIRPARGLKWPDIGK